MAKRGKLRSYAKVKGKGNDCPKCGEVMERRERKLAPKNKTYFFTEWDYCTNCSHVQHYEEFKSNDWKENEYNNERFQMLINNES